MKRVGTTALAPFATRAYRALWMAHLVSSTGTWMQMVGTQWFLVGHSAAMVTLVLTAAGLPVVLLALPFGVLADRYDRRSVVLTAQFAMFAVSTVLTVLAFDSRLTAPLLLGLTFLLGCGTALMRPAWHAIQPELVERSQLRQAAALGAVSMNLARAVGPVLGGLLVAAADAGWVFAFNALSYLGVAAALLLWKRPRTRGPSSGAESLLASASAGRRYVRHAPGVGRVLLRTILFIPGVAALWSLLPLVASRSLGLGPDGYGFLLGAVGLGAVSGAFVLPRLRRVLGANGILFAGAAVFAVVLAVMAVVRTPWIVVVALLPAGLASIGVVSTLNVAIQQRLHGWVRAPGLAYYVMAFHGGQALTAPLWGALADALGTAVSLLTGSGVLVLAAASVRRWPLQAPATSESEPSVHWPEPSLLFEPEPAEGPVLVSVAYQVAPGSRTAFTECMLHLARSRRRTGALSWGLYQDGRRPDVFIENYLVASWWEHLAQHHYRLTSADHSMEERVRRLLAPHTSPVVTHAFDASAGPVVTLAEQARPAGADPPDLPS
ncbi:MFS transporter [Streptomyces sp. NPDC005803]|uniref:MFS transporter n=1 Tax=Streptomyces sp. NPDC005803 TaxID=3154297 RepID=UPI0033E3396D